MVPLNPFKPAHLELDLSFLGARHPTQLAQAIAQGRINPDTHEPYEAPPAEPPQQQAAAAAAGRTSASPLPSRPPPRPLQQRCRSA